jgi:nucleoside-diphosphate-sugar epimerase
MTKPGMLITGAAGYLGRRLVTAFQPHYEIFAVDRRPPQASGAPEGPGIHWFQVDIGYPERLQEVFNRIREVSRVELLLHLAGYYDFSGDDHPEYRRSNVEGMRNVLELASLFPLKKLIFTSSVAACPFPEPGQTINEDTSPTAPPPYSQSKRAGEEMLYRYRDRLPAVIVRLAAIYTDWCEYEPLENFLATWFSGGLMARVMGGQGNWAIPYMHREDLAAFFLKVAAIADVLEPLEVLQGSPNGCTTALELYREATRSYYGAPRAAIHVPKPVARLGIKMREQLGRMNGHMPFERSWMGDYIDLRLNVDASRTHRRLDWTPNPDLHILQRIPIMVENMHRHPAEWRQRHLQRKSSQILPQTS